MSHPPIRLLTTDLDGTLIGGASEFPLYPAFRDQLFELRRNHETVWAICTGRSLPSFRHFFEPMRAMDIRPDYVIIRHAYIFSLTRAGYVPHILWNLRIAQLSWLDKLHVRQALDEWQGMIIRISPFVRTLTKKKDRLRLQFDSEDSARVAMNLLREKAGAYQHLQVFRYLREVDVRSVPFTKGLATGELARHIGVARENILTIGNGHNDISMLDNAVAGMTGCPANSDAEVMEQVHAQAGHIAGGNALAGVIEVVQAYVDGTVSSEFPEGWTPPSQSYNPRPSRSRRHRKRTNWVKVVLLVLTGYVVLMAFASFRLVPFSGVIMKPYYLLLDFVVKLLQLLSR